MRLRALRHPAWSQLPDTSSRTTFAVDVCSTINCTSRGRFLKHSPRHFQLVIDCSVGFCLSLANSFCRIRQIWSALRQVRCSHHYATILSRLQCVNCGDVTSTFSSLFLIDGVVTPFAFSRFHNLTMNSACRGSGSCSIELLSPLEFQRTHRFRILTSLTCVIATCTKDCPKPFIV